MLGYYVMYGCEVVFWYVFFEKYWLVQLEEYMKFIKEKNKVVEQLEEEKVKKVGEEKKVLEEERKVLEEKKVEEEDDKGGLDVELDDGLESEEVIIGYEKKKNKGRKVNKKKGKK